jgi:hypothetical protein
MKSCTDTKGFACFGGTAATQPIETEPASFKTDSAPIESTIAAKTKKPSSTYDRDRVHPATKTAKPTMITAKGEPSTHRIPLPPPSLKAGPQPVTSAAADTTRGNAADSHPPGGALANSTSRAIEEQVAAATAVAEPMTRGDTEKIAPASPNTDLLVALVMARPEIKSVSDLTNKIIAIDDRHSASSDNVRAAIVAAGGLEVQISGGQTKAINRLISGEVPAALLYLGSPEAAEAFSEIAGFKIFRIPLSSRH